MKNKKPKPKYRTRNWKQCITALTNRGSLTICIDKQARNQWLNLSKPVHRGRPNKYSDAAIVRGRRAETQTSGAMIGCRALNQMTSLGMPESYKVA